MTTLREIAWKTNRLIAQNGGPAADAIYKIANLYTKTYNNLNYDMETNGEYYLLDRLSKLNVKTIFDVGANKGDYTNACLSRFQNAQIHAFEIAPPTYEKLIQNVSSEKVRLNNFGLSSKAGILELNYSGEDDGSSSLIEGGAIHDGAWRQITVDVSTGDEYCRENGITGIDLLKVDVEGAEHLVFEGFEESFSNSIISSVQFEFGMVNIYSKFLLKDFYKFFERHNFIIGPVMPKGVNFRDYNTRDENFQGPPNFLAVHRSKLDLISAVRM